MADEPVTPDTEERTKSQNDSEENHPLLGRVSRRAFLSQLGAAGIAAATPLVAAAPAIAEINSASDEVHPQDPSAAPVTLKVNGVEHKLNLDPRTTLLDCLRENLELSGTKKGCDHGQCGACTVHVNGRRVNSCLSLAVMHQGEEITTIEGIGQLGKLHPMQVSFIEHDGYQCGYCTSGQIMSAVALMKEPVGPTDDDVRHAMYGNICRCGAYPNIVAAVQQGRKQT
jgi:xanthine dehydrogenase YagT iron-sulfur-binding subunit